MAKVYCKRRSFLTVGNLLLLPPSLSATDANHQIPQVKDVRDPGIPPDRTFISSVHCREAANTMRRLPSMVRWSFMDFSKAAFFPLFCAIVRPHLEYAMDANAQTLRADSNHLKRIQCLTTGSVRGLRHVPDEERLRQLNLFSLERRHLRSYLILAFNISKGKVGLSKSDLFLRPPQTGLRGHTYRLLQGPSRLRRRSGALFLYASKNTGTDCRRL